MSQQLGAIALLVRDYDEAIAFFTTALGFTLVEDTDRGGGKRWITVAPRQSTGTRLLLARADGERQTAMVGQQGGGRVFGFLQTDDFAGDYARMQAFGVEFCETPRVEAYGTVVVFVDVSGNRWDLIQPSTNAGS